MTERALHPWPANHRAALSIIVLVDSTSAPDVSDGQGRDYSATGLQRLIQTLSDVDIPATFAWTSEAVAAFPQLARAALDAGHELAAAGEPASFDERVWSRISGMRIAGIVEQVPGTSLSSSQEGSVQARPFAWRVTGAGGDLPVRSPAADGAIGEVLIPVSPYWVDRAWLDPQRPLPPSSLLEAWSLSLASMRVIGGHMTVVIHPHISGRPGLIEQVVRFFDEAIGSGDVWIASAAQVAAWEHQLDVDAGT